MTEKTHFNISRAGPLVVTLACVGLLHSPKEKADVVPMCLFSLCPYGPDHVVRDKCCSGII